MEERILVAVERAIVTMEHRLDEEITIDDMARAAMFSKFHFTRIFQRVTGVSPGRFLSALRIQRAKLLLSSTSWSVADISQRVGYSSVGTFSTRFKRSVGLSPTIYRRRGGFADRIGRYSGVQGRAPSNPCGKVYGNIRSRLQDQSGDLYVGVFPGPIPEERPISCARLSRPGGFVLDAVPEGVWYILACCDVKPQAAGGTPAGCGLVTAVGAYGPFEVKRNTVTTADVWMRPRRMTDPPILTAMLTRERHLHESAVLGQPVAAAA